MSDIEVVDFLKEIGCCDGCCLRYLGLKNPNAYGNPKEFIESNIRKPSENAGSSQNQESQPLANSVNISKNGNVNGDCLELHKNDEPPTKKRKWLICICCIGVLQEETWEENLKKVQEILDKKQYICKTFAGGLSSPIAIILREKCISLLLEEKFPEFKKTLTPLKEAWKWSCGVFISKNINKTLESATVSPLLIVVNMEYPDEAEELEYLKVMTPRHYASHSRQFRYQNYVYSRNSIEQALLELTLTALRNEWHCPPRRPQTCAVCISVSCRHEPIYLGGRYLKLSRELPQTPWCIRNVKMAETSIQEIMFHEIVKLFKIPERDAERHLKLLSAGREDVDVRCLGNGRPFAVEVSDPIFIPNEKQLDETCLSISSSKQITIKSMKIIPKNDLTLLKSGEESKTKVYEALCIKLSHSEYDKVENQDQPVTVSQKDIDNINSYTNVTDGSCRVLLQQKTPIRVLHRRSLHTRPRKIIDVEARLVPGRPQLFVVHLRTEAGTYIKEWVHGDLGRTKPSLVDAIKAQVDILALDVCAVELDWPKS